MISRGVSQPPKKLKIGEEGNEVVLFLGKDLVRVYNPGNESIIVSMMVAKHPVKCILVDIGSFIDVLLYDVFVCMSLSMEMLRPSSAPLIAFNGKSLEVEEEVTLLVIAETLLLTKTVFITFIMVSVPLTYNVILGRPRLNHLNAMVPTK